MKKRILSILLLCCMVLTLLPTAAFAANELPDVKLSVPATFDKTVDLTKQNGELKIKDSKTYLIKGSADPNWYFQYRIKIDGKNNTPHIFLDGVRIQAPKDGPAIELYGGASACLYFIGNDSELIGAENFAALQKNKTDGYLRVLVQTGTKLTCEGGRYGAGIGGSKVGIKKFSQGHGMNLHFGSLATGIYGGEILAISGVYGAGIGGGQGGVGEWIYVYSGKLTVRSVSEGAGIGGGQGGPGRFIYIKGGTVNAGSESGGAGIGSGDQDGQNKSEDAHHIEISGGTVEAWSNYAGAGIGGGRGGSGYDISITGGVVRAQGYLGAGIGGGMNGNSGNILIKDTTLTALAFPLYQDYGYTELSASAVGRGSNRAYYMAVMQDQEFAMIIEENIKIGASDGKSVWLSATGWQWRHNQEPYKKYWGTTTELLIPNENGRVDLQRLSLPYAYNYGRVISKLELRCEESTCSHELGWTDRDGCHIWACVKCGARDPAAEMSKQNAKHIPGDWSKQKQLCTVCGYVMGTDTKAPVLEVLKDGESYAVEDTIDGNPGAYTFTVSDPAASGETSSGIKSVTINGEPQTGPTYRLPAPDGGNNDAGAKYTVVATDNAGNETTATVRTYRWHHVKVISPDGNGTASASPDKAVAGTEIRLTATPNTGYHFKEWQVMSGGVTIKDNKFLMPNDNVEVKAIFEKDAPPAPTDPAKPSIRVTGAYTYNGSEHTATVSGYDPTTMDITGNTGTDAGDYTVSVTSKTGKWVDSSTDAVTAAWSIGKATREAPDGLIGVAPTTVGGSDGKISGVTDKMEYRMADENNYTACSGTEIDNLSAGNYFVRYAEDHNHFASPDTVVTVGDGAQLADCTITFNGNGGSGSMDSVTVKAKTNYILPECGFTAPADQEFKAWEIGGTEYKVGNSYTVNGDIEIKALWKNSVITPSTYTVTVSNDGNGTGAATPSTAATGTEIALTATPNEGYHFKEWQVISGGVTIVDDKFTMPDTNVAIKAIFEEDAPPVPTDPAKPNISVTGTYTYNGSVHTATVNGYDLATMDISGNTATDAGDYTVRVTSKTGKWADGSTDAVTAAWSIGKATQEAPNGLIGVAPTTVGGSDGKITGVDATMEYRAESETIYTACTGIEIENLSAGNYFVRCAGDHNHFASPDAEVTVGEGASLADCTITFNAGAGSGSMDSVTVKAGANYILPECGFTAPADQEFQAWEIGGTEYKVGDFYTVRGDTEIKALWENSVITPTTYTVTVSNDGKGTGTATPSTAAAGTMISLTATPNEGYHFKEWQVISGGVTIKDDKFTMPSANVEVKAIFEKDAPPAPTEYTITVTSGDNGTASASHAKAVVGTKIRLTATPNTGYHLKEWQVISGGVTIKDDKFTMPSANVEVKAIFEKDTGGGGGGYNPPVTYYTLRFETGGGSDIPSVQGTYNTYIDLTKYVPTWRGHTFIGWYSERSLMNKVSGVYLTKDMTVYAGWRVDENPGTGANPFTDVSEKDWFYGDVMFVYENGLMLGTSKTLFSPYGTATRGMMATILWRMEGSPAPKGKNSFTDVEAGKWYADAITWTAENGIFAGYGKDKFGPDDPITREQLAAIFYRYADYKGYDLTVKGNLDKFKDADKITDYAKTAMQWAVGSSLVKGKSGNLLDPQGTATRAEIAAMLHRFIEKYELVQGKAPGGLMGWIDPKRLQIPKTGDSSVLGLWGISLCTSLAGCLALTTWQIRRRREEESLQIIEK